MSDSTELRQPKGIDLFQAAGEDVEGLKSQLFKESQGRELFYLEVPPPEGEDGDTRVFGYPRGQVMDLIYETAYPLVKFIDDRASIKVKSNRAVTDFFVIIQTRRSGNYIGKHGQTLDALELLVAHCVSRRFPRYVNITVDVDNYRRKRSAFLESTCKRVIRDIERDHRERPIRNLLPKERKFIHNLMAEHPYLTTESRGEGRERTLFIKPREDIREV